MTNKKTDQTKPVELTEDSAEEVQGGFTMNDVMIQSFKDDRPKVAGTAEGWAGVGANS